MRHGGHNIEGSEADANGLKDDDNAVTAYVQSAGMHAPKLLEIVTSQRDRFRAR